VTTLCGSVHDRVDTTAIALPHGAEARLTTNVPKLDGNITLGNLLHVEAHRGDHVLCILARLNKN